MLYFALARSCCMHLPVPGAGFSWSAAAHLTILVQGKVVRIVQRAATWLGMGRQWQAVAEAPTLEAQRAAWNRQVERGLAGRVASTD